MMRAGTHSFLGSLRGPYRDWRNPTDTVGNVSDLVHYDFWSTAVPRTRGD